MPRDTDGDLSSVACGTSAREVKDIGDDLAPVASGRVLASDGSDTYQDMVQVHAQQDGSGNNAGAFYIMPSQYASRIVPETFLLVQDTPKVSPGGLNLSGVKLEQMLSELTLPGENSGPGREANRVHADFERRVLKEMQRYEQRVAQEMDPETASQLQEAETEVARLRDTLSGLRKQIDTEKEMQERILRDFRAQYGGSVAGLSSAGDGKP